MSDGIEPICKIFADDISDDTWLFAIVNDGKQLQSTINKDLENISRWAHEWKMLINPDPSKQETEVYFSRKHEPIPDLPLTFNKSTVQMCAVQKHLGLFLDIKLNFNYHFDNKINKCNKMIWMMKRRI